MSGLHDPTDTSISEASRASIKELCDEFELDLASIADSPGDLASELGALVRRVATACETLEDGLSTTGIRSLATDSAWKARGLNLRAPTSRYMLNGLGPVPTRFVVYFIAQQLRFDFKFASLQRWLADVSEVRQTTHDALLVALLALSAAGSRTDGAIDLIEQSLEMSDADYRSRHCCLHALWLAWDEPTQADRMLQVTSRMIENGEDDANVRFRRAFAYRKLGIMNHDRVALMSALDEIESAMEMHAGPPDVHQDYVRERELIVTAAISMYAVSTQRFAEE